MKCKRALLLLLLVAFAFSGCKAPTAEPTPTAEPLPTATTTTLPRMLMTLSDMSGGTIMRDEELNAYPTELRIPANTPTGNYRVQILVTCTWGVVQNGEAQTEEEVLSFSADRPHIRGTETKIPLAWENTPQIDPATIYCSFNHAEYRVIE